MANRSPEASMISSTAPSGQLPANQRAQLGDRGQIRLAS
jgi:hypothetical protein